VEMAVRHTGQITSAVAQVLQQSTLQVEPFHQAVHIQRSQTQPVVLVEDGLQAALMVAREAQVILETSQELLTVMEQVAAAVHGMHPVAQVDLTAAEQVVDQELQEQQELLTLDLAAVAVATDVPMVVQVVQGS
jgi:sulfur transfer complex TusBCD TusB component (DsrH family)